MKRFVITTAAVVAALFPMAAVAAPDPIQAWVAKVNQKVDQTIVKPAHGAHGEVSASFRLDANNRPTDIIVDKSSPAMMRAARVTLKLLRGLPTPLAELNGRRIKLQMLIGEMSDSNRYHRRLNAIMASATANNARVSQRLGSTQVAEVAAR